MNTANAAPLFFSDDVSPVDFIHRMYTQTDADGILYLSDFDDADTECRHCLLRWNEQDCRNAVELFEKLTDAIDKIARHEGAPDTLQDSALLRVWETYLRPFQTDDFDLAQIRDILERLEIVQFKKKLSARRANHEPLTKEERKLLADSAAVSVSDEEHELYRRYIVTVLHDADKRVGASGSGYDFIVRAMRLYRLACLKAPASVLRHEKRQLAAALVLHCYGISASIDKKAVCFELYVDTLEEEIDNCYRPKKTNSRKSLAPLFVYLILKEHSNRSHHLRQHDILKYLAQYPYEITIERKALGRILHNLTDSQLGICSDPQSGTWYDQP